MENIKISRGMYPGLFGGVGFHNNDAMLYDLMDPEFFWQKVCKSYREIKPGFCRTFAGFYNWTKEAMDSFAEYYDLMQRRTDTPMYVTVPSIPLHFNDEEIENYCEAVADKLAYLYFEKDVKHLRYYCLTNEMWRAKFGAFLTDLPGFKKYHTYLYHAFQKRSLPIGLLATDAPQYENWKTVDWALENMDEITDEYCVHIYERQHDIHDLTFYDFFYNKCLEIVQKCLVSRKRVILGECGIQKIPPRTADPNGTGGEVQMTYLKGVIEDVCRYFRNSEDAAYCGLMMTELSFAAINAGIFAIAYWTFIDCPDPYNCRYSSQDGFDRAWGENEPFITPSMKVKYNKWGMYRWDDDGNHDVRPHYWALAPLAKFFCRNTRVLDTAADDPLLRSCAVAKRGGEKVTFGVVSRHDEPVEIRLDTQLFKKPVRVYEYDTNNVPFNRFGDMQGVTAVLDPNEAVYTLKPQSVTYFTTDYDEKTKSVEAKLIGIKNGVLSWKSVSDPNHCYYRVFAGETADFELNGAHQIASTAAEHLPVDNAKLCYRVLSVDQSGNI